MSLSANQIILTNTIAWDDTTGELSSNLALTKGQIEDNLSETFHRLVEPAGANLRTVSAIYTEYSTIDSAVLSTIHHQASTEEQALADDAAELQGQFDAAKAAETQLLTTLDGQIAADIATNAVEEKAISDAIAEYSTTEVANHAAVTASLSEHMEEHLAVRAAAVASISLKIAETDTKHTEVSAAVDSVSEAATTKLDSQQAAVTAFRIGTETADATIDSNLDAAVADLEASNTANTQALATAIATAQATETLLSDGLADFVAGAEADRAAFQAAAGSAEQDQTDYVAALELSKAAMYAAADEAEVAMSDAVAALSAVQVQYEGAVRAGLSEQKNHNLVREQVFGSDAAADRNAAIAATTLLMQATPEGSSPIAVTKALVMAEQNCIKIGPYWRINATAQKLSFGFNADPRDAEGWSEIPFVKSAGIADNATDLITPTTVVEGNPLNQDYELDYAQTKAFLAGATTLENKSSIMRAAYTAQFNCDALAATLELVAGKRSAGIQVNVYNDSDPNKQAVIEEVSYNVLDGRNGRMTLLNDTIQMPTGAYTLKSDDGQGSLEVIGHINYFQRTISA